MKKSLLFLVVFALLWGGVATVQAYSGNCGTDGANVTWKLDTQTGVLEISGTGAMKDYSYYSSSPWNNFRSYITSVTIGEGVTSIGYRAFYDCKNLTSITIPNSVTAIGEDAFYSCTGLTSVTIPESVTSIGESAFSGCTSLTEITIGKNVTTIGSSAFSGCTGLEKVYISDLAAWCRIDFEINASNPLFYAHNLYLDNTLVTDLKIPDDVTAIGDDAFYNCTSLTSVTIGNGVTAIGEDAFYSCTGLTSVTIPNSVTSIGNDAFNRCSSLASVTIPESVTSIGESAFSGCSNLTEFKGKLASFDNRCLVINGTLVAFASSGLTEYSIPNEVKVIGDYAFRGCSGLTSVTIPNSVTSIGNDAFSGCSGLTEVTIGDGVTTIGSWAFYNCSGLTSVTIGDGVTSIGYNVFYNCTNLASVTIGKNVTFISYSAFYNCTSLAEFKGKFASSDNRCLIVNDTIRFFAPSGLTEYSIPNEVKVIGDYAFSNCTGLTLVTIGNGVTSIGNYAFSGCTGLASVTIDNGVTSIGDYAFESCGLTEVTIPENVTTIGHEAFRNCSGLMSITIPNNVTTINYRTFENCRNLTSVTIPESVTSIGESAFSGCTGLKKVYISDLAAWCRIDFKDDFSNPLFYAHNLYLDNTLVTDLKIPDDVTEIYPYAFYGCTSLTSVTIGNGVTTIGANTFVDCTSLVSVTIGKNVNSIAPAFYGCSKLRTITALSATPPNIILYESWSAFDEDIYKYATVNYPKGTLHIYKNADGWKNFTYPTAEELLKPKFINGTVGQTTYSCTLSYTRNIEYPVSKLCIPTEGKDYLIDTSKTTIPITVIDLEPQTEYKNIEFVIETVYGETVSTSLTFTTDTVHLTTQPAINVSNTSATLTADIECDALTGAGFEWRRYDDPELVPSTFSETPIVDGKISGTLRNLSPEKYYKYRPFYRTAKGKYYYGEWLAFGTRDIYAYFEPTVSTRSGEVRGNTTTLSGYIVEGSDEIISQGFEYWAESPAGSTTAGEHKRVEGSGSLMNVTLTGLDYNTTYYYRAYATTAKKTTYGTIESFTTGENPNPSGIEETAAEEGFAVRLSGNPVRNGEIGVQVVGADGATWYRVISLHGAQIAQGVLSDTDEWQPVKIPAASRGHYLLQIIGSKGTKTLRIVVE